MEPGEKNLAEIGDPSTNSPRDPSSEHEIDELAQDLVNRRTPKTMNPKKATPKKATPKPKKTATPKKATPRPKKTTATRKKATPARRK